MAFKLYTLDGARGHAEKIRMLLAETGIKYEEVALNQSAVDEWTQQGKLNFGSLPALEHEGCMIENAAAIMEYLAIHADKNRMGQGGNKYCGEAVEAGVVRGINSMVEKYQDEVQTFKGKDGAPANAAGVIARWFGLFQAMLERNDDNDVQTDEYLYGKHLTYADISMFEAVNATVNIHGLKAIRSFPKLKEIHDKIGARARIEQHIATRAEGF
jgi:glutathione S-transferase